MSAGVYLDVWPQSVEKQHGHLSKDYIPADISGTKRPVFFGFKVICSIMYYYFYKIKVFYYRAGFSSSRQAFYAMHCVMVSLRVRALSLAKVGFG